MVRANENLALLSAEAPIHQPVLSDGSAYHMLQEELKGAFEVTILDLPRHVAVQHPHLLNDVAVTVVVTELTLAAARDMIRLKALIKQNAPDSRLIIVANKFAGSGGEISRKDFEETVESSIDMVVAYDPKMTAQAAKLGRAYSDIVKGTKAAQPLVQLANKIVEWGDDVGEGKEEAKGKAGKKGKFDIKSFLTSSKSAAK